MDIEQYLDYHYLRRAVGGGSSDHHRHDTQEALR